MHSTKHDILTLLKRNDGATVDALASSLELAPMTVRQHLMALERDTLVRTEEVRRATGRPHYRYLLSDEGHRRISDGHDRMLALLVEEAGLLEIADIDGIAPADRRGRLFARAATALADRHRAEVRALSNAAQADRIASILRSHGGFADWIEHVSGYELRDFACVYRANVHTDTACVWHETFLSRLIDAEIRVADGPADCARCCRYVIASGAPVVAANKGNHHDRH